jgi:hypothetical protein
MLAPISAHTNGSGYTCQLQPLLPSSAHDCCRATAHSEGMAAFTFDLVTATLRDAARDLVD